ncbi:hypothetical protein KOR34_04040 [Posidoniimonas corsicana]|uniref:Dockerin domain-containing protein n=1 Tax=Posidoniimonas corsicana TaxID=1938618 RepID=A0A5C5VB39_9BACT|nr:dockerin type I repeat-containing protein [Posidoniimonas corsicana]TWT35511.1 hypothetical protein KOR34_04040 [Posidoniimonas corsicana]
MFSPSIAWLAAAAAVLLIVPPATAHKGGILVQQKDGRLVTGYDDESTGAQTIGDRAFGLLFPSSLANDVPSFLSLANAPAGSGPLPVGTELHWDFLPIHVGGQTANLMYWDAATDVVSFASSAPGVDFTLYTEGFSDSATVDGSPAMVRGKRLGAISANNLALHAHRWFFMESSTSVPEGVYLAAMQVRAEGFASSEPFYVAAATSAVPSTRLDDVAVPWVAEHADTLLLAGDYNFDGAVDAADLGIWRQQYGTEGAFAIELGSADGNYDGTVDAADYTVWRDAMQTIGIAATPAPEPACLSVVAIAAAVCVQRRKRGG